MEEYKLRVIEERKDLDDKLNKLILFIGLAPIFGGLNEQEKCFFFRQRDAMIEYSAMLTCRIALYKLGS